MDKEESILTLSCGRFGVCGTSEDALWSILCLEISTISMSGWLSWLRSPLREFWYVRKVVKFPRDVEVSLKIRRGCCASTTYMITHRWKKARTSSFHGLLRTGIIQCQVRICNKELQKHTKISVMVYRINCDSPVLMKNTVNEWSTRLVLTIDSGLCYSCFDISEGRTS